MEKVESYTAYNYINREGQKFIIFSENSLMEMWKEILFAAFVIASAVIHGVDGYAMVSGTVFCDQCRDGHISLFDYPLYGIKVGMACPGSDVQFTILREEVTNWVGYYAIKFDGTPDLSSCHAQVTGIVEGSSSPCVASAGPPINPTLMFSMFGMEMYSVGTLLSQPAQPMPFCLASTRPTVTRAPPARVAQPVKPRLPPLPPLPPMPLGPFLEVYVCSPKQWMMPKYRCYWKAIAPDTKVATILGLIAGRRYGKDTTLWEGMKGKGDPYRTLLREGTTALLNSYTSVKFPYHPLGIIQQMNWALMGSKRQVLHTALSFLRANCGTGGGGTAWRFTPCK